MAKTVAPKKPTRAGARRKRAASPSTKAKKPKESAAKTATKAPARSRAKAAPKPARRPAARTPQRPDGATAALVLEDGTTFWGLGVGAAGETVGEICFNTSMTGYQEILTDPSYAGQIINFTFPHIGNVGTNPEDVETTTPAVRGCVLRADITLPSNYRAAGHLDTWLKSHDLVGLTGVDTRRLTRKIREHGAPRGALVHRPKGKIDPAALKAAANAWPGLEGMDLAKEVTCRQTYHWDETPWRMGEGYGKRERDKRHVVAIDFGAKRNILRSLAGHGCKVTVLPASATAADVLGHKPDGIFLSNGPGDPAATGAYAIPAIQQLIAFGVPIFGICLGHQILALALGAKTTKMHHGHRGANHPVKDLKTGKVEITSQNHGFVVSSLPAGLAATHISLFDQSIEGFEVEGKPIFAVQYHPEASPGPHDSNYLFERFVKLIDDHA
ncbi:MAG: glutamine-hydrolyzing carbamoyl-phosphate synthase small subunit [Alphaproteobacteria bacterium]|nr:glutamine-hydrolyzing carbamoyl-phosphate synthase small subunit [Alphaproteobacteria bacterium]